VVEQIVSPNSGSLQTTKQVVQRVLGESTLGTIYCQQLWQVIDYLGAGCADGLDVTALPVLTCQASGGEPRTAVPVAEAWQLARLAAKLLDDVEDGESETASAEAVNAATGLLFAALLTLRESLELGVFADRVLRLERTFHRTGLRACAGQHADLMAGQLGIDGTDPDTWLEIARSKSGGLLGWAAWAGALVAGADEHAMSAYHGYGRHLGVLLQVADDFNGVWSPDGTCDLTARHPILPVCYALHVSQGKERDRLEALLDRASRGDREAEVQAQQLLIDLGAQGYTLVVARVQHRRAVVSLRRAGCASPADRPLVALLDRMMPALELASGD
jgi:geranylgeranyl pyrophosphate synthase